MNNVVELSNNNNKFKMPVIIALVIPRWKIFCFYKNKI